MCAQVDHVRTPNGMFAHPQCGSLWRSTLVAAGSVVRGGGGAGRDGEEVVDFFVVDFKVADFHFDAKLVLERVDAAEELQTESRYDARFGVNTFVRIV